MKIILFRRQIERQYMTSASFAFGLLGPFDSAEDPVGAGSCALGLKILATTRMGLLSSSVSALNGLCTIVNNSSTRLALCCN